MHRIAILSAAGAMALAAAGQANGAPVQCPEVSFTRTPVPAKGHRVAHSKPRVQLVKHHHAATRRPPLAKIAKHASGPRPAVVASNTLPVLAPILSPDTLPATTPVLAPGVTPATPILGYRLQRSVKMVACQPAPTVSALRNDLIAPRGGPGPEAASIPTAFQPPSVSQFQTSPPQPPGGPPKTPPGCCDTPPFEPPSPPRPPGAVPEPATWAMLIVGFFGLGSQLRRAGRRARETGSPQTG